MTEFFRTRTSGCFQVRTNAWGSFLAPLPDPEAHGDLEKGALESFELNPDIARIPADLWSRWVQLCFHYAHLKQGDLEVSCRLLRHEDDRSRWRILVPKQAVSGASVRIHSFDSSIDIETGELVESYPPPGWIPAGSSHSHNSMPLARFSSIDDASELGCPGLHIVLSHICTQKRTYVPTASVTANHRRFYLDDAAAVIDLTPLATSFHPTVLTVIEPERPSYGIGRGSQGVWLPGHLSREDTAIYDSYYGGSTASLRQRDRRWQSSTSRFNRDRLADLDTLGLDAEDLFRECFEEIVEGLERLRRLCAECSLDPMAAHDQLMQAVNFTFDEDDPLWYTDENPSDYTPVASSRPDSATP